MHKNFQFDSKWRVGGDWTMMMMMIVDDDDDDDDDDDNELFLWYGWPTKGI